MEESKSILKKNVETLNFLEISPSKFNPGGGLSFQSWNGCYSEGWNTLLNGMGQLCYCRYRNNCHDEQIIFLNIAELRENVY